MGKWLTMPTTEDDFGRSITRTEPRKIRRRAPGQFTPRNNIGVTLLDLQGLDEGSVPRPIPFSEYGDHATKDSLTMGSMIVPEISYRREKKTVIDSDGQVIDCQRPSSGRLRSSGLKRIDFVPAAQKGPLDGSKRCYDWIYRPGETGYQNPMQYEEPPVLGKRPSHPVPAIGLVELGHKRSFPKQQYPETGLPPPRMNKAPNSAEWGGWAKGGAPGRKPQVKPWEVADDDPTADSFRVCDARLKRYPENTHATTDLLTWHWDPKHDVDTALQKRVHLNQPLQPVAERPDAVHYGTNVLPRALARTDLDLVAGPPAGKPSMVNVEGSRLGAYDRMRAVENMP